MRSLRLVRYVAWSLLAFVGTLLVVFGNVVPSREKSVASEVGETASAVVGKPFVLTSHRGIAVTNETLKGRPYLAFFGFTHCPEICPTTLFELTDMMKELGAEADAFNVIFITVDPERDSRELLQSYMTSFDERILALRGTPEQTDIALKAFAAYARRVPEEGGAYTMDHTAGVYLMDAEGMFRGMLDMHEPKETRMQKVRNLIDTVSLTL